MKLAADRLLLIYDELHGDITSARPGMVGTLLVTNQWLAGIYDRLGELIRSLTPSQMAMQAAGAGPLGNATVQIFLDGTMIAERTLDHIGRDLNRGGQILR